MIVRRLITKNSGQPKLLHRSHALRSDQFLKEDSDDETSDTKDVSAKLLKKGFQKFSSNRFGRVLNLAGIFVENRGMVSNFYEETVDPHANKLFLACYSYLRSPLL